MPIYKPEEYDAVLERIKAAIKEQDSQMGPVLSRPCLKNKYCTK